MPELDNLAVVVQAGWFGFSVSDDDDVACELENPI